MREISLPESNVPDCSRADAVVDLSTALPGLWSARERERLVPFIGAGLSRDYCRGWTEFVQALSTKCGSSIGLADPQSPEALYRIADRAAAAMRQKPRDERGLILKEALLSDAPSVSFDTETPTFRQKSAFPGAATHSYLG
jgi:hypothetical protein